MKQRWEKRIIVLCPDREQCAGDDEGNAHTHLECRRHSHGNTAATAVTCFNWTTLSLSTRQYLKATKSTRRLPNLLWYKRKCPLAVRFFRLVQQAAAFVPHPLGCRLQLLFFRVCSSQYSESSFDFKF
eukprot:scpid80517/ scgid9993/ 